MLPRGEPLRSRCARSRSHRLGLILAALLLASLAIPLVPFLRPATGFVLTVFEEVGMPFVEGEDVDKGVKLAQSFVATANYKIVQIDLLAYDLRQSDIARLTLRPDRLGFPDDAILATSTADGVIGYTWLPFPLDNRTMLTAGRLYWIVLESAEPRPDGYRWAKQVNGPYAAGYAARIRSDEWDALTDKDFLFRTWGISGPSIAVDVSVSSPFAGRLDPLQYTIAFDNDGTALARSVWVNASIAPHLTLQGDDAILEGGQRTGPGRWTFFAVAPGPHRFHLNVTVNADAFDGLPLPVTATLDYLDLDGTMQESTTATAEAITRVPSVLIRMAANPWFVGPGEPLTFTVTVDNAGSQNASYVWINDTLPSSVTYVNDTAGLLPVFVARSINGQAVRINLTDVPPSTFVFDLDVLVAPGIPNGTWITNVAQANYTDTAGIVRESVSASATARVHGANIRVQKVAQASLVQPTKTLSYVIQFDNVGNAVARNVWINDTLPVGLSYGSDTAASQSGFLGRAVAGGNLAFEFANVSVGSHAFVLTTQVAAGLPDGTALTNRVRLDHTNSDDTPLVPSWSNATVLVAIPIVDLTLTGDTTADPGDLIDIVLTATNAGTGLATDAWLNVTLPGSLAYVSDTSGDVGGIRTISSWRLQNVAAGTVEFRLTVRVASNLTDSDTVPVSASVEYLDAAGIAGPRVERTMLVSIQAPRFVLAIAASRASVEPSGEVDLILTYRNEGNGTAGTVWINQSIPAGSSFVRSTVQYAATSGRDYTWRFVAVAPGTYSLSVTLRVDDSAAPGTGLTNRVTLEYADVNGNFVETLEVSKPLTVAPRGPISPAVALPAFLLMLVAVIAVLSGYIAWRVYGIGSKDRARIDDILLLHRSGMLMRHFSKSLRPDMDSDLLSGMIVAVQNFVRESFKFQEGALEELKYGRHRLLLAHGKFSILAAVVSGRYTERLWPVLTTNLKALEDRLGPVLKDWDGDLDRIEVADDLLAAVLNGKADRNRNNADRHA